MNAGKTGYTVLDLFCGCGGASLGFRQAGFKIVGAVDIDESACATYQRNLGLRPLQADLRLLDGRKLLEALELRRGDVDVVVGCPPCQSYSCLHRTRSNGNEGGNYLIYAFVKIVRELRAPVVVMENVPGLTSRREFSDYLKEMEKMGYSSHYSILNAKDFGVPQVRKRLVCISFKDRSGFPEVDFSEYFSNRVTTVRDAIGDLPPIGAGEKHPTIPNHRARSHSERVMRIIAAIPKDGGSRKDLPRWMWLDCHRRLEENGGGAENVYGRMWWDRPAPTITTRCTTPSSGRFIHPEQDRSITPREAARLQTFPDNFVFPDSFAAAERLIGNAFPPKFVANCVAPFIRAHDHLI
jgi:DNA (cytosine-5)-methyltransferase 1